MFFGEGAKAPQILCSYPSALDLYGDFALSSEHEVHLQAGFGSPKSDREVPFPIASVREQFHQDEVLEGSPEVRTLRAFEAAAAQVPGYSDIEQVELGRPRDNGTGTSASEWLEFPDHPNW